MTNFFREDTVITEDKNNIISELYKILPIVKHIDVEKIKTSYNLVVANLVYQDSILIEHFSKKEVSPLRSLKAERKVIEELYTLGLVDIYRAPSNRDFAKMKAAGRDISEHLQSNGKRRLSEMCLTDKGKLFFAGVTATLQLVTRRKKIEATKSTRKRYDYFPFQKDELQELGKYKNFLTKLNKVMEKHTFSYTDFETGETVEFNNDYRIIFSGNQQNKIYDHRRRGGRFVSTVSYMWKQNRKSVLIDGQNTIEIDYKCCLPSIMFGKFKVDLSGLENDLYYVPDEENCEYMRLVAKKIVVCALGTTSEYTLKLAVDDKYYRYKNNLNDADGYPVERFFPENFTLDDIERVIGKILKRYRELCPRVDKILFKKDLATNILQGVEARIATRIMNQFVSQGKPILCIHDSFRVLEEDEDLLYKLMQESYFAEVGMNPLGLKVVRQDKQPEPIAPVQDLQVKETSSFDFEIASETDHTVDDVELQYDCIGNCTDTVDTFSIQYVFDGIIFRFDNVTGQDYAWDSAFKEWVPQNSRSAFDRYVGVA